MSGIGVRLPLHIDYSDGAYALNKEYADLVKQNLKNLIFTAPGERIYDPLFGCGLRNFLFENAGSEIHSDVSNKIATQVSKYMPFIEIIDIDVATDSNLLSVSIRYKILPLDLEDLFTIIEKVE